MSPGTPRVSRTEGGVEGRTLTVLFTPSRKFLPGTDGRHVEEIAEDGVAFGTRREMRTRVPLGQAHECSARKDDGGQGGVRGVLYYVDNRGESLHLWPGGKRRARGMTATRVTSSFYASSELVWVADPLLLLSPSKGRFECECS